MNKPYLKFLFAVNLAGAALFAQAQTPLQDLAEQNLLEVMHALAKGDIDTAVEQSQLLVNSHPDFRLAQLIHGDVIASLGHKDTLAVNYQSAQDVKPLLAEARARLSHRFQAEHVPAAVLGLATPQRNAAVFDLGANRLYIVAIKGGRPEVIGDHYISIGQGGIGKDVEGDLRTPVGVYQITGHLGDAELPTLYGHGAYPINYPNAWDRLQGKTGYGIWLHGVPHNTYSRPPLDSEGCMVISNVALDRLGEYLDIGSPVILSRALEWVSVSSWQERRRASQSQLQAWQTAWESMDVEKYLDFYSAEFKTAASDKQRWATHKRRVTPGKSWIKLELTELEVFQHPANQDLRVVSFTQAYRSNNFQSKTRKQQYWRLESDGRWRIVYEGKV